MNSLPQHVGKDTLEKVMAVRGANRIAQRAAMTGLKSLWCFAKHTMEETQSWPRPNI